MMRVEAFRAVGGFDPSIPAGEEPELCQRIRANEWAVIRLNAPMTRHDLAMFHFRQWAKRQFRTGYGGMDFSTRFGKPGNDPFRKQIQSAWVWTLVIPLMSIAAIALSAILGGTVTAIGVGVVFGMIPLAQAARIGWRNRGRADGDLRAALAYGFSTILGKPFQAAGHLLYLAITEPVDTHA